jgi:TetR/AcrR family transcriptional regulator, regulator of autoinduction and epiphytic fitness
LRPIETDLDTHATGDELPAEATHADGRSARSQRTRDAVVDALLALLRNGNLRPTAREIADEAGTSLRSVYVHFDDLEDLFCAASARQNHTIGEFLVPVPDDIGFEERLRLFVTQRSEIWEATAPVRAAAALQEPFSVGLSTILAGARAVATTDAQRVFRREFDAIPHSQREAIVNAVDAIASGTSWDHWRRFRNCSTQIAQETLTTALRQLLTGSAT